MSSTLLYSLQPSVKGKVIIVLSHFPISDDHPKRDSMSMEEATFSNMWESAAIVELFERKEIIP